MGTTYVLDIPTLLSDALMEFTVIKAKSDPLNFCGLMQIIPMNSDLSLVSSIYD